jgi:anaerobic dimethyl sulfoxide reductase subunit A
VGGAGHYAIFMQQAIAPMYECRNDIDICADLRRALGIDGYNDKTEEQWLRELTKDTIDDFDTFREAASPAAAPEDAVAFAREIRDPEQHPFTTPSGKIEIYSMAHRRQARSVRARRDLADPDVDPRSEEARIRCAGARRSRARARTRSTTTSRSSRAPTATTSGCIRPTPPRAASSTARRCACSTSAAPPMLPARVTDRIAPGCVSIKEGAWFTPDAHGHDTHGCANVLTATAPRQRRRRSKHVREIAPA